MIPISFDLPAGYRVSAQDYDNGVSLYMLENATRGDVVLAMYHEDERLTDGDTRGGATLGPRDEVIIDGTAVPAKINGDYMLLAFERAGVCYTLSSRDDMGALAAFYRSITRGAS
jgi:hypothetical protein